MVGFLEAYLKCNLRQLRPFEKLVVINIVVRQKCLVNGYKKAYSKNGRMAAEISFISQFICFLIWKFISIHTKKNMEKVVENSDIIPAFLEC